jgi:uncharacterized protein (TIGR03437 family)
MKHKAISGLVFGLLLMCSALQLAAAGISHQRTQQQLTPAPSGPFHVADNRIVDSKGRPFLMRGTQLTEFHPQTADRDNRAGQDFGPHSSTTLSAIRLRFNMNTVRLPLDVTEAADAGYFAELAKVVRRANNVDLLVILAAREPGANLPSRKSVEFWSHCAAYFKDYPNVMFDSFSDPSPSTVPLNAGDPHSAAGWSFWRQGGRAADGRDVVGMQDLVRAIRSTGATQSIVAMIWKDDRLFEGAGPAPLIDDPNVIYEASPRYASTRTDAQRDAHFGLLADRAPILANGWDLNLDDVAECSAIPSDPTAATQLVQGNLDYFDAHRISWTVSVFEPGKLIKDLSFHDATSLGDGWSCGHPAYPRAGIGRVVESHLRSSEERGIFVVSQSGGLDVARGGVALAYGPIMAERDSRSARPQTTLGKLSVQVTDALGVTRQAGIRWASAGWGQLNFIVPVQSALGPARMTIVRQDGTRSSTNITIGDTAPGFWTEVSCRGPAVGSATQVFQDGRTATSPVSFCKGSDCRTIPIPVTSRASTRVRLAVNGFRYAGSASKIEVTIGGIPVRVVSFGPSAGDPGVDQMTIEIPAALRGLGETDLICHLNGRVANAVRINVGGEKPAS